MGHTPSRLQDVGAASLGFRVKSGRAIAVLLAVSNDSLHVLDRREINLCDPAVPQSRQPYHAKMGTLQTNEATIKRLRSIVMEAAEQSASELLKDYRVRGQSVHGAGLVVGSETDPTTITNTHIRAHAHEGQLFRTVLEDALRHLGLPYLVFVERKIYAGAAKTLNRPEEELKRILAGLGQRKSGPWRSDEKTAALAAWLTFQKIHSKSFI